MTDLKSFKAQSMSVLPQGQFLLITLCPFKEPYFLISLHTLKCLLETGNLK